VAASVKKALADDVSDESSDQVHVEGTACESRGPGR
jgi:hypothetical protein